MPNLHVEINLVQTSKHPHMPCGDVVSSERNSTSTTIICCDGIGSGIKANIAATLCVSRLRELLKGGFTFREAFGSVVKTMHNWRSPDMPFAAFSICRILHDGTASILSYECPPAILLGSNCATLIPGQVQSQDGSITTEANCILGPGDSIILMSDGITQAGLGNGLSSGWQSEGVVNFANTEMLKGTGPDEIATLIHHQARQYWGQVAGDDCTVALAKCRQGKCVNIMTGPPSHPGSDAKIVHEFINSQGTHVVCGATTAAIVARHLGKDLCVSEDLSLIAPPKYSMDGIDLVTEGAVTLNQVYNILDEDPDEFEEQSGVTELWHLLKQADCIRIVLGRAFNPATGNIAFRQKGILTRSNVIPLLADKLRNAGKLVLIRPV
jgi:hypothetical protein